MKKYAAQFEFEGKSSEFRKLIIISFSFRLEKNYW